MSVWLSITMEREHGRAEIAKNKKMGGRTMKSAAINKFKYVNSNYWENLTWSMHGVDGRREPHRKHSVCAWYADNLSPHWIRHSPRCRKMFKQFFSPNMFGMTAKKSFFPLLFHGIAALLFVEFARELHFQLLFFLLLFSSSTSAALSRITTSG